MKLYEGMFLLDPGRANRDWDAVAAQVHQIIERHGGQITKSQKWGERKLAYEIAGHKRGVYMLVHFQSDGSGITGMRRDAGLSDVILRTLIVIDTDGEEAPDIHGESAPEETSRSQRSKQPETPAKPEAKPAETEASGEDKPAETPAAEEKPETDKADEDAPQSEEAAPAEPSADAPDSGDAQ